MNVESSALAEPVRRHEDGGFTLVELLTVVVVIGILAALILAALSKAKAQGRSTVCKSNLSQTGRALEMYLSDNNIYPSTWAPGNDKYLRGTWADELSPYNPLPWTNNSWQCPTYIANNGLIGQSPNQIHSPLWTSYSYNSFGIAGLTGPRFPELGLGVLPRNSPREQQVLAPAEMYAVADAREHFIPKTDYIGGPQWMNPYHEMPDGVGWQGTSGTVHAEEEAPPHAQGYNMLFCDTHVALVKRKDYLYPPRTARHWNRDNQPHPELWAAANEWIVQN
jgi:prepilin-type N-terminal cleavage/methylation domain-containing protein/prepilin-type processing-associated H-X9-DG protein